MSIIKAPNYRSIDISVLISSLLTSKLGQQLSTSSERFEHTILYVSLNYLVNYFTIISSFQVVVKFNSVDSLSTCGSTACLLKQVDFV